MACSEQEKPHHVLLFLTYLCLWWSTTCIHVEANDSLKPGDTLNATVPGAELCSKKGKYCMSFDPITHDNQEAVYLTIYAQKKDDWEVWVANRNQPVDSNSAVLSLDYKGVLKIESQDGKKKVKKSPIILYSPPQPINNTVATLLDTGNFVLQQLHPNGSKIRVLWESFDIPTDTLLPGMKLGLNHKTGGTNWSLVSWLSGQVPAAGPFKLEWEPKTRELLIIKRGGGSGGERVLWASGNELEHIPSEIRREIVPSETGDYFTLKSSDSEKEPTKWTLLSTGQLINRKGVDVARADMCYGYNTDGGCQKWDAILPSCRRPGDAFELKHGYPKWDTEVKRDEENSSYGISDCQEICWRNCSCVGFALNHRNETGCVFFLWDLMKGTNIANEGNKFYVLVRSNHQNRKWVYNYYYYS